jgi:type III pantothenate kinase
MGKQAQGTWTALVIGNSRLHWAQFAGNEIRATWDSPHLTSLAEGIAILADRANPHLSSPLWIVSVVPAQTALWTDYPSAQILELDRVPLQGLYPTMGIDRAVATWGAIVTLGSPILVIDAGTALTLTGVDGQQQLVGGAILPGLGLQLRSLHQHTAALPLVKTTHLPQRWAQDTPGAIASGILYTLLAGLQSFIGDWRQQFPGSPVVLTGGDGDRLLQAMQVFDPEIASSAIFDPHLIFKGIGAIQSVSEFPSPS